MSKEALIFHGSSVELRKGSKSLYVEGEYVGVFGFLVIDGV